MDGYGEGGRRSRPCEPGLAGWYGLAARAIQVCDVQENDFLLETARSQPGWLAWPGRARHQHPLCTGRTSSCRKPSFVKGAGPKPGITNLLSTGKPIPCRKPPFVKGAGPGPGIRNLLSTEKPSPCRKPPFVEGAGPGPGIRILLSTGNCAPVDNSLYKGSRAQAGHQKSAKYGETELL